MGLEGADSMELMDSFFSRTQEVSELALIFSVLIPKGLAMKSPKPVMWTTFNLSKEGPHPMYL